MVRNIIGILLYIFFFICPLHGLSSTVTQLSIKSESRGFIFIIKTDRPIDDSFQNILNVSRNHVTIELFNVTYGMDKLSFTNLSENSPVEKITINGKNSSLQFHITLYEEIKNKVKTKYKGNEIQYFLSDASCPKMDWTYSELKKSETTYSKLDNICSISKIDLVQDGNVEKLIINIDNSVQVKTQNREDALIAVFENAVNGFSQNAFILPDNSLFKKIVVKESFHNGSNVVGLILYKSIVSMFPALIYREPSKFSIYTIQSNLGLKDHLTLWSSNKLKNTPDRTNEKQQLAGSISTDPSLKTTPVYNKNIETGKQNQIEKSKNLLKKDAFVQSVEKITQIPRVVTESEEKFKKMTVARYRIFGRDPYLPLNNPEMIESDLPDIEQCKLVGILFDENIKVALIENITNGEPFALEENSDILHGRVIKINRKKVTFLLNGGGYSQRYIMNLQSNKSKDRYEKKKAEK